jgi:hypothetical protein
MALSAGVHDFKLETSLVGAAYRVGGVAIATYRQWLVRLRYVLRMNAFAKLLFNAVVTFAACPGNVVGIDARKSIRSRQFPMRRVAIGARCCDNKAAFQQPLSMDALGVSTDDLVLPSRVPNGGFLPFLMTAGAKVRNIGRENR